MGEYVHPGIAPGNQFTVKPDNAVSIGKRHGDLLQNSKYALCRSGLERERSGLSRVEPIRLQAGSYSTEPDEKQFNRAANNYREPGETSLA
ncbi:hypothetical protein GCM10008940_09830 [Microbulbifer agarilyticus]